MTLSLAALAVALIPLTQPPQDDALQPKILGKSDVTALNKDVKKWFASWQKWDLATKNSDRRKYGKARTKDRGRFEKNWKAKSKKGDPLSSVPDIRAVFDNAFQYARQSSLSGTVKAVKPERDSPGYSFVAPKRYDPRKGYRGVLVLPGFDSAKGAWESAQEYFTGAWKDSTLLPETICVFPDLDDGMELDVDPDFSQPAAEDQENERLRAILGAFGQIQREFNLSRDRLILDCGRGSSKFGLRLASYFPSRFAGVVIRWPTEASGLRLGSLRGLPIVLVANAETKAVAETLQQQLNADGASACTILDAKGTYPFVDSREDVAKWAQGIRRNLSLQKLVLEPNSDRFNDGYWIQVGTAEPLASVPKDQAPMISAEADREANRITVAARNISDFRLLLNDDLLDLDKPFTVVINGTAIKEQRERNMDWMIVQMQTQFDPTYVFTTYFDGSVPKSTDDNSGEKPGGGDAKPSGK